MAALGTTEEEARNGHQLRQPDAAVPIPITTWSTAPHHLIVLMGITGYSYDQSIGLRAAQRPGRRHVCSAALVRFSTHY
jgi:hypothetical protein